MLNAKIFTIFDENALSILKKKKEHPLVGFQFEREDARERTLVCLSMYSCFYILPI